MLDGDAREMGLGSYTEISLSAARGAAGEARELKAKGIDPIDTRDAARARKIADAAKAVTFRHCVDAYIDAREAGWHPDHAGQWRATLETYAMPTFGSLPVAAIDTTLVHRVREPIWKTKTVTASRIRGRIEAVLDWAGTRGYRQGENPARWRGHLEHLFPASKVRQNRNAEFEAVCRSQDGEGETSAEKRRWRVAEKRLQSATDKVCETKPTGVRAQLEFVAKYHEDHLQSYDSLDNENIEKALGRASAAVAEIAT